jgi:hypothetical protein
MASKAKLLGLVLVALVVLGDAVAPSAMAKRVDDFESEAKNVIFTGTQLEASQFKMAGGSTVTCKKTNFNGTQKSETKSWTSLTLEPTYEECTVGELSATVDNGSCHYIFTGETDAEGHAKVTLECPKGGLMKITTSGCTIEIAEQEPGQGASYEKTGTGETRDVDVKVTATPLKYASLGLLCGLIAGNGVDMTLQGNYTLRAYEDKEDTEGSQIGFWYTPTVIE